LAPLARLGCGAMPALARQAAAERALLRIDMPQGAPPAGSMVQVGDGAEAMRLKVLGPATSGDAQLQTAGVLALAEGAGARARQRGPRAARPYRKRRRAGRRAGAALGAGAADGALYAYRATGKDGFERVALTGAVTQATDGRCPQARCTRAIAW
jgi:hypothetical protein